MSYHPGWSEQSVLVTSFAVIAIVCALRAVLALVREDAMKLALDHERARAKADLAHRDALLSNGMQGIVIMGGGPLDRQYVGSGKLLFEMLQESTEAPRVANAIDALINEAKPFAFAVSAHSGVLSLRGQVVGRRAVLYLCEQPGRDECSLYRDVPGARPESRREVKQVEIISPMVRLDMLRCMPQAIAVFDVDQVLCEHNDAFAELWSLPEAWLNTHPTLGDILEKLRDDRNLPEQRQFSDWRRVQLEEFSKPDDVIEAVWHLSGGKSIHLHMPQHPRGGRLVICEDISASLRLEASLNLLTQVQKATLDTLDEGVAIFGTDGRLVLHNGVFAGMWRLTDGELASQPHFGEIASLCVSRFGRDMIWEVVAEGINSTALERFREWSKLRRADDRIVSLSLSRLPNGATLARFTDMTDLERFTAMQSEASGAAA